MNRNQRAMLSWDAIHAGLVQVARSRGEWAGVPMPIEGMRMVIHPSYPFAEALGGVFMSREESEKHQKEPPIEDGEVRNCFLSVRYGCYVSVCRIGKKFFVSFSRKNSGPLLINTLGAARAWDYEAELRAMETLKRHVTDWQFKLYVMTGMFLESSKRSGLIYLFRRLKPTVALTGSVGERGDRGVRILCALCAHGIGYYHDSFAGALVPTDDIISHLLLMRADEHYFWRICNQHPAWAPEAAL